MIDEVTAGHVRLRELAHAGPLTEDRLELGAHLALGRVRLVNRPPEGPMAAEPPRELRFGEAHQGILSLSPRYGPCCGHPVEPLDTGQRVIPYSCDGACRRSFT